MSFFNVNQEKFTVPGNSTYANMVSKGKKVAIYGDSIIKRIKVNEFNKHISGTALKKSFPGANCEEINHYIDYSLRNDRPDCVIIHAGTNDLGNKNESKDNKTIANEIMEIARKCKANGVNQIFISGITCRSGFEVTRKLKDINDKVRNMCVQEKFNYICNDEITTDFLWRDGLHLLDEGTNLLADNFIYALNSV